MSRLRARREIHFKGRYLDGFLCAVLAALTLLFSWLFVGRFGIFGSQVDWISQHSVIPDYFRQQFYDTGELFPEFAPNLGGGQNIYNFSYYGLYSPVILPSYLLPSVKMGDYLMGAAVVCLAASAVIFYCWLRRRAFSRGISFCVAMMLLLAGPMIFHSSRHVMFVDYMPFLCLALWGIDRYFEPQPGERPEKAAGRAQESPGNSVRGRGASRRTGGKLVFSRRAGLYTMAVFLMIMTSFYYSVGGMLVLTLYGLHRYVQEKEAAKTPVRFLEFLREGILFLVPMATAVLMSGILLVPTALALSGRQGAYTASPSLGDLLKPSFSPETMLYSAYGTGLTSLILTVTFTGLFWPWASERVLSWGCGIGMGIPLVTWLLNGCLYPREKALIPFLPLLCYMTACYFRKLERKEISFRAGWIPYLLTVFLLYQKSGISPVQLWDTAKELASELLKNTVSFFQLPPGERPDSLFSYIWSSGLPGSRVQWVLLLLDGILMALGFLVFARKGKPSVLMILPVSFLILSGLNLHTIGSIESREFYDSVTDREIGEAMAEVLAEEPGLYRMEQVGTDRENQADINRIWNMDQYITSLYSSSYNESYRKFRAETFGTEEPSRNFLIQKISENPVFRRLMGVKYLVVEEEEELPEGTAYEKDRDYKLWASYGRIKIYRNDHVIPVCYATDRIISREEYEKLEFPYNQRVFLDYAVLESCSADARPDMAAADMVPIDFEIPERSGENGFVEKTGQGYSIQGKKSQEVSVPIPGGRTLYLQFQVNNQAPRRELSISVEGMKNKLSAASHLYYNDNTTFTYALPLKENQREVRLSFGKGSYEITGLRCYLEGEEEKDQTPELSGQFLDGNTTSPSLLCQSEFQVNKEETKGSRISGTIDVDSPGYFVTSIPYDEGFRAVIDGVQTVCQRVNTAFVGFPIAEGHHKIELIYCAPGMYLGKAVSLLGIVLFSLQILLRFRKKNISGISGR